MKLAALDHTIIKSSTGIQAALAQRARDPWAVLLSKLAPDAVPAWQVKFSKYNFQELALGLCIMEDVGSEKPERLRAPSRN